MRGAVGFVLLVLVREAGADECACVGARISHGRGDGVHPRRRCRPRPRESRTGAAASAIPRCGRRECRRIPYGRGGEASTLTTCARIYVITAASPPRLEPRWLSGRCGPIPETAGAGAGRVRLAQCELSATQSTSPRAVRAQRDEIHLRSIRATPPGAMRAQVTSPKRLPPGKGRRRWSTLSGRPLPTPPGEGARRSEIAMVAACEADAPGPVGGSRCRAGPRCDYSGAVPLRPLHPRQAP